MAYDRSKDKEHKAVLKSNQTKYCGKVWTKESIKELIRNSNTAVERAILRCYSFQTDEEKYRGTTKESNGKGFNRVDADLLSSYALQLKRGRHLSKEQLYKARIKVQKYAGQLLNYIREKADKETL